MSRHHCPRCGAFMSHQPGQWLYWVCMRPFCDGSESAPPHPPTPGPGFTPSNAGRQLAEAFAALPPEDGGE